jgi:succinyl-CoA synthetase beta subunit
VLLTVKVAASVSPGTVLTNSATVSSSTPDPVPGNNTATASTTVNTSADVWLDKQATQRSGNPAPIVTYTLVVHNDTGCETDAQSSPTPTCGAGGPSDARDIMVTDHLPLDPKKLTVQFVSPQCTYTVADHTVVCLSSNVPAGTSVSFVIEAQVQGSVGTITNSASVASSTFDPVMANNINAATLVMKGGTGKRK